MIDKIKEPKKIVCQQTFAKYLKQGGIRKKLFRLHFQEYRMSISNYCNTYFVGFKCFLEHTLEMKLGERSKHKQRNIKEFEKIKEIKD